MAYSFRVQNCHVQVYYFLSYSSYLPNKRSFNMKSYNCRIVYWLEQAVVLRSRPDRIPENVTDCLIFSVVVGKKLCPRR